VLELAGCQQGAVWCGGSEQQRSPLLSPLLSTSEQGVIRQRSGLVVRA
jgi:hypothetical protein